eukprot:CAMPEP_0117036900 /NCGR_PEP_ID=MMETSP0472-20121206/26100_1 /TAXON_ID=693140 ORGANISM="Tiarina fusus, Strain LIS" /NCGR_SAMPLE_ID=MMETSP0472 /ASSEMBLY_ACC=CAM_ASM_000603 /LENGTH=107 /DNA_ID=CAMNT_0004746771 /DNA_START=354 /DNA_END=674 /DNA_ORIENTATION=+
MVEKDTYERHLEIHWDHWFMLAYQHDVEEKKQFGDIQIDAKKLIKNRKEAAVIQKMLHKDIPGDSRVFKEATKIPTLSELNQTYTDGFHYGFDIPVEWMMAMKLVKW